MAAKKRLRGNSSCCGSTYWATPYIVPPSGRVEVRGTLHPTEEDAIRMIEGRAFIEYDASGTVKAGPHPTLPNAAYYAAKKREDEAIAVIRNGRGPNNRIADTWPMDPEWYRTNGSTANNQTRANHAAVITGAGGEGRNAHTGVTVWCAACESGADQFLSGLAYAGKEISPAVEAIAMAASYVPVLGTAISFMLTTALNLAKGKGLDEAALDGIGAALPGQPASRIAYEAARSIARGEPLDQIAIKSLPIDEGSKRAANTALRIVKAVVNGENLTEPVLNGFYAELPPAGKKGMDAARRLLRGDDTAKVAVEQLDNFTDLRGDLERLNAMKEAARNALAAGPDAQRAFIAQAGYQGALSGMKSEVAEAITIGFIGGRSEVNRALEAKGFTTAERNPQTLDEWAARGQLIINSGAMYTDPKTGIVRSLAAIRAAQSYTITRKERFDAVSGRMLQGEWVENIPMTGLSRRGFDIGIGAAEGQSEDGPGKQNLRSSLTLLEAQKGFDLALHIQFNRTLQKQLLERINKMAIEGVGVRPAARVKLVTVTPEDKVKLSSGTQKGQYMASQDPSIASARALNPDGKFRWGFDFATALCQGMSENGPGQQAWRERLGPYSIGTGPGGGNGTVEAQQGFDVGQALQYGITKARVAAGLPAYVVVSEASRFQINPQPDVAAGMLLASGIAGTGQSGDVKAAIIEQTFSNPAAKQGAATVIAEKTGFFAKVLAFFGL